MLLPPDNHRDPAPSARTRQESIVADGKRVLAGAILGALTIAPTFILCSYESGLTGHPMSFAVAFSQIIALLYLLILPFVNLAGAVMFFLKGPFVATLSGGIFWAILASLFRKWLTGIMRNWNLRKVIATVIYFISVAIVSYFMFVGYVFDGINCR